MYYYLFPFCNFYILNGRQTFIIILRFLRWFDFAYYDTFSFCVNPYLFLNHSEGQQADHSEGFKFVFK